jgi:hypothetical protein
VLYGGARAGGKSFSMLLDWMRHAQAYGKEANGLILRKELVQLKDLIKESIRVYTPLGRGWRGELHGCVETRTSECRVISQNGHAAVSDRPRRVRRPSTMAVQYQRPRGSAPCPYVRSRVAMCSTCWPKPCPGRPPKPGIFADREPADKISEPSARLCPKQTKGNVRWWTD